MDCGPEEARDGCGVGAVGALIRPEDVEVAQAHGLESVERGKHLHVQLVRHLGDRVGGQRRDRHVFAFWQRWRVAVGGRRGGEDHAAHAIVARGVEHGDRSVGVHRVARDRSLDAARDGAEGGLVEDHVDARCGAVHRLGVADVGGDALDVGAAAKVIQVLPVARGEVVDDPDPFARRRQRFDQIGADEPGAARHQMQRHRSEPLATLDFLHHAPVLDLPQSGALFDVLELRAHLFLDLFLVAELPAQGFAHASPKLVVLREDLLDRGRVHQHLEQLVQEVVDGLLAQLDLPLIGHQALDLAQVAGGQVASSQHVLGLLADLVLVADVLIEHCLDVELHLSRRFGLDGALLGQEADHLCSDLSDPGGVDAHGGGVVAAGRQKNNGVTPTKRGFDRPAAQPTRPRSSGGRGVWTERSAPLGARRLPGAQAQAAHHRATLPGLVGVVTGLAGLVHGLGLGVQQLELAEHVDDRTQVLAARRSLLHQMRGYPQGHVRHEMNDAVGRRAEAIVAGGQVVVDLPLEGVRHLGEVRVLLAEAAEVEDGVGALPRDDVVEGEQTLRQVVEHRQQVLAGPGHDAKTQLVVERRRGRLGLREQLGVGRVEVLASPDELRDREALAEHGADHAVDLLFDEVKQVAIADRQAEQELAPCHVVDDVHRLQDGAGAELAVSLARGQQQEVLERRPFDGLRDREGEHAPQVADGLDLDVVEVSAVALGVELVILDEARRGLVGREVQPMPVDHRVAAQNHPQGLDVVELELTDGLEARGTGQRGTLAGLGRDFVLGRGLQALGCPGAARPTTGRLRLRVPKKMPSVSPRTASWAPMAPLPSSSSTGTRRTRYRTGDLIISSILARPARSPRICVGRCARWPSAASAR